MSDSERVWETGVSSVPRAISNQGSQQSFPGWGWGRKMRCGGQEWPLGYVGQPGEKRGLRVLRFLETAY